MGIFIDGKKGLLLRNGLLFTSSTSGEGDMANRDEEKEKKKVWKNRSVFFSSLGEGSLAEDVAYMWGQNAEQIIQVEDAGTYRCDGLVTNISRLLLAVPSADCFPILLFDIRKGAFALLHCGWWGTYVHLPIQLLNKWGITKKGSRRLQDIIVAFGPGICGKCYEVENPIQLQNPYTYKSWEPVIRRVEGKENSYLIDIGGYMVEALRLYGIPEENIIRPLLCTKESPSLYSHRRGEKERFLTVAVMLK